MVGLAICYDKHNYGSMLQAYATQKILDKMGIENEVINLCGLNRIINRRKRKYYIKAILTSDFLGQKKGMLLTKVRIKVGKGDFANNSKVRDCAYESFKKRMFHISISFNSFDELTAYCEREYKAVIVGSDQLWLPGNIAGDFYTLNFVPDKVGKIAYATSFGQNKLPLAISEKAVAFLNRIKHIGVREKTGQAIIFELTGKKVPVVCDPAMLLTAEEWMNIQKEEPIIKGEYILCYFLGKNPKHRQWADKLRAVSGCRIVGLLHLDEYVKNDEEYVDISLYDVGPSDFLNLIRNAKYVCTDSFHCSLFSILYHKDFFAFRRYTQNTEQSTNSRLDTLFAETGIFRQILTGYEELDAITRVNIDYAAVDKKVEKYRRSSMQYLENSLREEGIGFGTAS